MAERIRIAAESYEFPEVIEVLLNFWVGQSAPVAIPPEKVESYGQPGSQRKVRYVRVASRVYGDLLRDLR
jgi:hypothetical protein